MTSELPGATALPLESVDAGREDTRKAGLVLRVGYAAAFPVAVITLVGLVVRLYNLTGYGIWFDEGYHLALIREPSMPAMLDAVLSNPPSDPLYVLVLRGWAALFGNSDAAVRLLSVIFSAATIPAAYLLGATIAGRGAALLGAVGLALSPYAVELGQEAALYSLAALTTTCALLLGWRLLTQGKGAAAYIAAGTLAIYSHYVAAAVLTLFALLSLYPGVPRRVSRRSMLLLTGAIWALWLPWLLPMLAHLLSAQVPRLTLPHPATWEDIYSALVQFTSGTAALGGGHRVVQLGGLVSALGLLAVGLAAAGRSAKQGLRVLGAVGGLVFTVPAVLSALTGRWLFVPHFMLFLLPALLIVVGAGAEALWREAGDGKRTLMRVAATVLCAIWLGAQVWGLYLFYRYPPHGADGLREMAALLSGRAARGERVLVTPPALQVTLNHYYAGVVRGLPEDFDLRRVYLPYKADRWNRDSLDVLEREVSGGQSFWLVYRPELDSGGGFLREVSSHYSQTFAQHWEYATLYRFSRR